MDGETRAQEIESQRLDVMLLARSAAERAGRDWRSHPIFRQPDRIVVSDGRVTFMYRSPLRAFSVIEGRCLTETVKQGNLVTHTLYGPDGRVQNATRELHGNPTLN